MEEASERISLWQRTWDEAYKQFNTTQALTFNISGWVNSYTYRPYAEEEMREWVHASVERILARPGWEDTPAIRSRRVAVFKEDLFGSPGPRLAQGLEQLAALLQTPKV